MEQQEQSHAKRNSKNKSRVLQWLFIFTLLSCNQGSRVDFDQDLPNLPNLRIVDDLRVRSSRGILYVRDTIFSGTLYQFFPNSLDTASIQRYLAGKAHGVWKQFYAGHELREIRYFKDGKKEGAHIGYWENGTIKFHYHLQNDVYEGSNKEWMPDGQLVADMNYHLGQEEGPQKVWYPNGKIKANYIIRKGRRYGLLGTKNCTNVSDSVFVK